MTGSARQTGKLVLVSQPCQVICRQHMHFCSKGSRAIECCVRMLIRRFDCRGFYLRSPTVRMDSLLPRISNNK